MSELELILAKLKLVSEEEERGYYLCDKEHSKILLDEIERLNNILDKLGLSDKNIDKETKFVNMTVTLPKWLKDIGKKNKINFSKLLQESLYKVLQIGVDKE